MIITEYLRTRNDGVVLNRTYSDAGFYIERDGVQYVEAVDPAELNRVYTETTVLIEELVNEGEAPGLSDADSEIQAEDEEVV